MIDEDIDHTWKQHFPTYHFDDKDIALEEYRGAIRSLEAEERIFLNASNITFVAAAAIGSLSVGISEKAFDLLGKNVPKVAIFAFFIILIMIFSIITLKYFADRQKSIVFAARKIIILRRMLGLSYGSIQLILPNWRVEGADQPFAVKLFPGWNTYIAYPFYILSLVSITTVLFLSLLISKEYSNIPYYNIIIIGISLWFGFLAFVYRTALLDTHERFSLLFIKDFSKTIYLSLVENFEYIIYRAKLAAYEINRQEIELDNLIKILIFIEDKEYLKHRGISIKGIGRSILSLFKRKPRSGGSTITQQIARTLFIHDLYKTIRRKIVEICLALWLNSIISKKDLLEIYLASVRFEKGIFGVADAMNYFFGCHIASPSMAQSFFLIERVSNIRSKLLYNKIVATIIAAKKNNLLTNADIGELVEIYEKAIHEQKIIDDNNGLRYLKRNLLELK